MGRGKRRQMGKKETSNQLQLPTERRKDCERVSVDKFPFLLPTLRELFLNVPNSVGKPYIVSLVFILIKISDTFRR